MSAPVGGIAFQRWRANSLVSCDFFSGEAYGRNIWNQFYGYALVTMSEIRIQVSYLDDGPVDPITVALLPLSSTSGIIGSIDQICELPKCVWKTCTRQGNGAVCTLTNRATT